TATPSRARSAGGPASRSGPAAATGPRRSPSRASEMSYREVGDLGLPRGPSAGSAGATEGGVSEGSSETLPKNSVREAEDQEDGDAEDDPVDDEHRQGAALEVADEEPDRGQAGHERGQETQAERGRLRRRQTVAQQGDGLQEAGPGGEREAEQKGEAGG